MKKGFTLKGKKILNISTIVVGILIVSVVGTKAATTIQSSMVSYNNTTVKETLDDLVDITVQGNATAEDITTGKTAVVQGKLITGTKKEQKFENIYYYDKNTEGDNIVRYIKVGDSYYPCDENGTQISTTPLNGTITIVSKTDTSTPSNGETQLVKYEPMTTGNVSAGAAGFNEQSLILGSGSDNINYKNLGAEGVTYYIANNKITYWGGADMDGIVKAATATITINKSGQALIYYRHLISTAAGSLNYTKSVIYHNGTAITGSIISVSEGDTISIRTESKANTLSTSSHIHTVFGVLNVIVY